MAETAMVRMYNGEWRELEVCGRAPSHGGQRTIVVCNENRDCFAARLTPSGFSVVDEPVQLFPVT